MIDQKGAAPLIKKKGIKISVEEKIKSKADYYHEIIVIVLRPHRSYRLLNRTV